MKQAKLSSEQKLLKSKNDIKKYSKTKNDLETELAEIQEAGRIDTTPLENVEAEYVEALEKSAKMHDSYKSTLDEKQSELKELKKDLREAEKKQEAVDNEIKEQEKVLNQFIVSQESRSREEDKAKKVVATKMKAVQDVEKILENQLLIKEEAVIEASKKVINF